MFDRGCSEMKNKSGNVPIYGEVSDELMIKLIFSWLIDYEYVSIKPISDTAIDSDQCLMGSRE